MAKDHSNRKICNLGFRYFFREGLPETLIFAQVLGLIAAAVLLIYGNTFGDVGEILIISFVFANFMALSIKFTAAVYYHYFYRRSAEKRLFHAALWIPSLVIGTVIGSELALGFNVLVFGTDLPGPFMFEHLYLLIANLLITSILSMLAYSFYQVRKKLERKTLEHERILRLQSQTQLIALQAKINPHFLFNTLNTMLSLVKKAPEKVETMILNLSDIYRRILRYPEDQRIELQEELRMVKEYLEIESIRLGSRLSFQIDIEPEIEDFLIPPLLIEPLVENAVIHGIGPKPEGGEVRVRGERNEHGLRIMVRDNGVGISEPVSGSGYGLHSVKERLNLIYKEKAGFEILPLPEGGTEIVLEIPYED